MKEKKLGDLRVKRAAMNSVDMIVASGTCDIYSAHLLKDAMAEVIKDGKQKLIVDVKNLRLDQSGVAAILWARHKIEETGGNIVIVGLNKSARAARSLGNLLDITPSIGEALRVLNKSGLSYKAG